MLLGLIFGLILAIIIYCFVVYNRFIAMGNRITEEHHAIDTYLLQRFDQLSKLADVVFSYTNHEQETHLKLVNIRSNYTHMSPESKESALHQTESLEKKLQLQVENYPNLKASRVYGDLMSAITDVEEKISANRRSYNANIYKYNTKLQQYPSKMIGSL